ncbi:MULTISPECIES: acyl-CoA dehydrogenase family protein [Streptomyces]|uniref:Acyl-CoA/acyl-ACP dehydrogenase n=1 Tax=Streptomyces lycii TaxID=2654337 RepID=A0ABQ7FCF8_9ACTN|nr:MULTISPECIES: acyl-CoA dehydrogenase family protein [Streptomyces]KAF4406771.1 acyl-CoA/acyl-ACP dehydrogenase [Streptomyces lycii]PGH48377.1 acyl-CoA dehydrogenase [Streptomyces sp. Ru87]
MFDLDERLNALRRQFQEWGHDFRRHALELDADPEAIRRYFDLPAVRHLATMGIPAEYGNDPEPIAGRRYYGESALERAVIMEELACADAGMLVASPGPLLAGVLVDLLADERQKEWFYGRMTAEPLWTFFALTEPDRGSDAGAMTTALTPAPDGAGGGLLLSGAKRYVGNAARAQIGVVFARTRPGPLGVTAVFAESSAAGFRAEALPMIGLRGAMISSISLDSVAVPEEHVLGRHLSPSRRGTWAFVQTFNRLRPGVAAIAVGIARAAHTYVFANRRNFSRSERDRLDELGRRINATRKLVHRAAAAVDLRTANGHLASAAKVRAAQLAEDATLEACSFFGPGARFDHPLLDKLARDARAMEFLEGTGHMQRLNLFQGYQSSKFDRNEPFPV